MDAEHTLAAAGPAVEVFENSPEALRRVGAVAAVDSKDWLAVGSRTQSTSFVAL